MDHGAGWTRSTKLREVLLIVFAPLESWIDNLFEKTLKV